MAPSGHTAHPDEIRASCQTLQAHIVKAQEDAEQTLKSWEDELRAQDLADKRKVAPGWLDRQEKILEPKKASIAQSTQSTGVGATEGSSIIDQQDHDAQRLAGPSNTTDSAGEELDRAFGTMAVRP